MLNLLNKPIFVSSMIAIMFGFLFAEAVAIMWLFS